MLDDKVLKAEYYEEEEKVLKIWIINAQKYIRLSLARRVYQ